MNTDQYQRRSSGAVVRKVSTAGSVYAMEEGRRTDMFLSVECVGEGVGRKRISIPKSDPD